MRTTSATFKGFFFGKYYSESYLITAMLKLLLINYVAHWQQHFEGHPTFEDFMDMDQDKCLFCHQNSSEHHEMKINEGAWKLSHAKKNTTPQFKKHCTKIDDILLVVMRFFLSQTYLVFKSNPLFIDILLTYSIVFATVHSNFYLLIFTFILRILKYAQCI